MSSKQEHRSRGAIGPTALLASLIVLSACAQRPADLDPPTPPPSWPPPPDAARIVFVTAIRVPDDLGIRGSVFSRIYRRIVYGKQERGMARPYGVAAGPDGTIAVADPDGRCVHVFDVPRGRYRRIDAASGEPLLSPIGVVFDTERRLYVSDSMRNAIFRFDADGRFVDRLGEGELLRPTGLAYDTLRRTLWVVETHGHRLTGLDDDGHRVARFGGRGAGPGEFNYPVAVAVDPSGLLYVSDSMNFRVQVVDATGRFVKAFGRAGNGPGDFDKAKGIALDSRGHVYVVEGLHDVVHVYDSEGHVLTVVGRSGNRPGEFGLPAGIFIDGKDRILVADSANRRIQVLRFLGDPS